MRCFSALLVLVLPLGCGASEREATEVQEQDRARRLHEEVPLIDGHNDLPGQYREEVNRRMSELISP